MDKNTFI